MLDKLGSPRSPPAWSISRKADLVNPRRIRDVGLSSVFTWINVTGCSCVNVYLPNLIDFLMLYTQTSQAKDSLMS